MDRPTRPNMGSANARRDGFRIAWPYQLFVLCQPTGHAYRIGTTIQGADRLDDPLGLTCPALHHRATFGEDISRAWAGNIAEGRALTPCNAMPLRAPAFMFSSWAKD